MVVLERETYPIFKWCVTETSFLYTTDMKFSLSQGLLEWLPHRRDLLLVLSTGDPHAHVQHRPVTRGEAEKLGSPHPGEPLSCSAIPELLPWTSRNACNWVWLEPLLQATCSHSSFCEQEAVLKATAVRSPLPVMSSNLPCHVWSRGGGGSRQWGGSRPGGGGSRQGGQGHFIHLAIYCTTTWCLP